jgi:hypothetical protein
MPYPGTSKPAEQCYNVSEHCTKDRESCSEREARVSTIGSDACAYWQWCLKVDLLFLESITPPPYISLAWSSSDCLALFLHVVGGGKGSAGGGGGRGRRLAAPGMGPLMGK